MIILCNVCFTYIVTSALLSCNKQDSSLYTYYPFLFIPDFSSVFLTRFSIDLNFY